MFLLALLTDSGQKNGYVWQRFSNSMMGTDELS